MSKKPAILFQPEERTLYLLFDLEKLICSQSTLEDEFGKVDRHGRFLASFHQSEVRWKIPALEVLGKLVRESFGFSDRGIKSGIVMTHDVDRVSVEPFLFMKNIIAKQKIEKFAFTDEKDYLFQNVRALLDIDSENAVKPVWFFLSGNYSFRRYGNRYNSNSSKARKLIAAIAHRGQSIGLHTSYYGAFDPQRSLREKRNLEGLCGMPIYLNRCHYLRFEMRKSIALFEKCGLTLDSTMGYSDANGFRSGLCRPFHPWNHEEGKISEILEIPLLFMDSVHSGNAAESWNDIRRILYWVNEVRGCGAILFHPYSLASNKDIKALDKDVIEECHRLNIPFLSIDDVVNEQSGWCRT